MQRFTTWSVVALALAGCAGAEREPRQVSCAELADLKAARQMETDSSALDADGSGGRNSALQRDFIRMDAEAYREKVRRNCLKLRSGETGEQPGGGGS